MNSSILEKWAFMFWVGFDFTSPVIFIFPKIDLKLISLKRRNNHVNNLKISSKINSMILIIYPFDEKANFSIL
ncbi:hypothetical protein SAMN05444412_106112 [Rhodonellum ikkaensis]|uniref:Uncharacterized protein n=1 Tax=Rhodonellum ikkaensis TaxID=336829 RepID=A0A1H3QIY4_9BACT|nr:hypothetical protein SAMN05444412_106112 [Rhodonellum ikkaensis]